MIAECFLEAEVDILSSKLRECQFRELRTFTPCYHGATGTEKIEREELEMRAFTAGEKAISPVVAREQKRCC